MDRELVFAILGALALGPSLLLFGSIAPRETHVASARDLEQLRWRSLWFPLLPSALLVAAGVGWALVEPSNSEALPVWLAVVAVPFTLVWARALTGAARALRAPPPVTMATAGLLRPRLLVADGFRRTLDRGSFEAALLHERVHALHHDPFRIWIAQFATDLQWPCRSAARRLTAWREALELARDEEARLLGADGADLAAAVLEAARLKAVQPSPTLASVHDGSAALTDRVRRLLVDLPPYRGVRALTWHRVFALAVGVAMATGAGSAWGERLLRAALA